MTVVPKPFGKAAKRKLKGESLKHYTRANDAPGIFKPLVLNCFGGVGPEFSSLLSEFAESELERSSGFAKLKLRLKPALRDQLVNSKKRRYLTQLQFSYLDLSGQALSAHRSGVLGKRGSCRFWSEKKNAPHFWKECPVEQISRPYLTQLRIPLFRFWRLASLQQLVSKGMKMNLTLRWVFFLLLLLLRCRHRPRKWRGPNQNPCFVRSLLR